ncbi:MAG: DUF799 domain-containing protein [Lachnoclostridium sp.]|nr:DUF799 domain-containing protein [Lachnoclostridium sp.]
MNKIINLILFTTSVFVISSCSPTVTRQQQYGAMYEYQPKTIVVMPPINQTNFAEAKDYFYTTMALPLIEKGYYVFSPYLTLEMFQTEGAYDSEMFIEGSLEQFKDVLNCDAVMFTRINKWEKKALDGKIKVDIDYILKSTSTGEVLYTSSGEINLDKSLNGGGGAFGALVSIVATALNTAATEKVIAGRACNQYVLQDLPEGPYSPNHLSDGNLKAWGKKVKATLKAK